VSFGADGGELEVLVGGQLGDDGGEEGDHPELAKEDESKDGKDEDYGGKDTFHEGYKQDICNELKGLVLPDGPTARGAVTS
jgi:hypothetical protein